MFYIRKNSIELSIPLKSTIRTLLFILAIGLFFPFLMGSYASFIFVTFYLTLSMAVKKSKSQYKLVQIIFLIIFGIVFIAQSLLWAFLFFRYSKSIGFVLILDIIVGVFVFIFKNYKNFSLPTKNSQFHFKITQKAKIGTFIIVMAGTGLFFPLTFFPHHSSTLVNSNEAPISIDLMSYNIRNAGSMEEDSANLWKNRKEYTTAYIDSLNVDIFGVQEAYFLQLEFLRNHLSNRNYGYYGVGRDEGTIGGEIEAIFWDKSIFTYVEGDTFWLSDTPSIPSKNWDRSNYRTCTWIRLEERNTNTHFFVFNTHLSTQECVELSCVQQKSVVLINRMIRDLTGDLPVILLGDFNMQNTSEAFSYLENYGEKPLYDSFKAFYNDTVPFDYSTNEFKPFDPSLDKKRIDYIFLTDSISIDYIEIPKDHYGENQPYSDHYPVVATISIN